MSVNGFWELMLEDGILFEALDHPYKLSTQLILGFVEAGMVRVDGDGPGIESPGRVSGNDLWETLENRDLRAMAMALTRPRYSHPTKAVGLVS